jgi:hypothetical protein
MKTLFMILILSVSISGHSKSAEKLKLDVDVSFKYFNETDKQKVYGAVEILKAVMNSETFKQKVLAFHFKGENRFHQNNGMTNQEIYNHLMEAREDLMPDTPGIMNFFLELYRSKNPWSSVKGYTKPDTMTIWLNTKFFRLRSWTAKDVAGNMAHEWVHKMGFGHDYYDNADRAYSVPYAIGYLVEEIASEMGF